MAIIYNPTSIPLRIPFAHYKGYNYIKPIRIVGVNTKLIDYQVKIDLDSDNFPFEKCRADGNDIRFVDTDGQSLNYWLESWSKADKTGKVWCKIPEIESRTDKLIWLIYGKSDGKSTSNGTNTFIFFDDFSTDLTDWTTISEIGDTAEIVDGYAKLSKGANAGTLAIQHAITSQTNCAVEVKIKQENNAGGSAYITLCDGITIAVYARIDLILNIIKMYYSGDYQTVCSATSQWYTFKVIDFDVSSDTCDFYAYKEDDSLCGSDLATPFRNVVTELNKISLEAYNSPDVALFDDVRVRKYNSPEPQIIVL